MEVELNVGESICIENYIITIIETGEEFEDGEIKILIEDIRDFEDDELY